MSGVEPLLKRSGRETPPLRPGKGEELARASGDWAPPLHCGDTDVSLDGEGMAVQLNNGEGVGVMSADVDGTQGSDEEDVDVG